MNIGIIELLLDTAPRRAIASPYASYMRKQFTSVMPQTVAVWCRELGHRVCYATYYGQCEPHRLLPDDLDVVFVATYTQASALSYALAKVFRRQGALTVIGGPHAKCFPQACLRHFDLVVKECDKALIEDILRGQFDPSAVIGSGRPLTEFPSVEERMPDIRAATFAGDRPAAVSVIPVLASIGCPYSCDFCTDWNNRYISRSPEALAADLRYISSNFPRALIGYHDPNFAVRFDEVMDVIESIPEARRNRYVMESSLAILKGERLHRLRRTKCVFVAPGVESWADYSNKSGVGRKSGRDKLEQVVGHFALLGQFVPGLQANFLFGTDLDEGRTPVDLTNEFMHRLPYVWPAINIPTPYGGTPLFQKYLSQGRILREMPVELYFAPYLVTTVANYDPLEYYDLLIELYTTMTENRMLLQRILSSASLIVRLSHVFRTFAMRAELAEQRRIRKLLATDRQFRAFHENRSAALPEFYNWRYEQRLGRYAELISRAERRPVLEDADVLRPTVSPLAARPLSPAGSAA